jgi:hypothetical protein
VGGWLLLTVLYGAFNVTCRLSLRDLEGYEKDWQFQVLAFCYSRLPWLILVLVVSLLVERFASRNPPNGRSG